MSSSNPTKVLVVEDDLAMRLLLSSALREEAYDVVEAGDGVQALKQIALAAAQFEPLDLIVTDACMPGASGLDVIARLRSFDWVTPVVLITAFGSDELRAEAIRLGTAVVLDKPFQMTELQRLLFDLAPPHRAESARTYFQTGGPRRKM